MPSSTRTSRSKYSPTTALLLAALCAAPGISLAQQSTPAATPLVIAALDSPLPEPLPDAPSVTQQTGESSSANPKQTEQGPPPGEPLQTGRILGIMPNFRSVSADEKLPPQSPKQKFLIAGKDTFDYSSFIIAGIQAGFAMNSKSTPEFHQGAAGYARYYWHTLADTIDENFMVGGAFPAVFHQDNRFYTLGHGSGFRRAAYAASRVVITRTDAGDPTFNFSEIIGAGAAAGVSSTYYPSPDRTWTKVGQKWLTSMIIDGANFTLKEFWPDINQKIFHTH